MTESLKKLLESLGAHDITRDPRTGIYHFDPVPGLEKKLKDLVSERKDIVVNPHYFPASRETAIHELHNVSETGCYVFFMRDIDGIGHRISLKAHRAAATAA